MTPSASIFSWQPLSTTGGGVHYEQQRYQQAIADYSEAIRLSPLDTPAYANRAIAYALLGLDTQAQDDIDRAIEVGADRTVLEEYIDESKRLR